MRLMQLERHLEQQSSVDEEDFEDAETHKGDSASSSQITTSVNPVLVRPNFLPSNPIDSSSQNGSIFIPPTIPEGDE